MSGASRVLRLLGCLVVTGLAALLVIGAWDSWKAPPWRGLFEPGNGVTITSVDFPHTSLVRLEHCFRTGSVAPEYQYTRTVVFATDTIAAELEQPPCPGRPEREQGSKDRNVLCRDPASCAAVLARLAAVPLRGVQQRRFTGMAQRIGGASEFWNLTYADGRNVCVDTGPRGQVDHLEPLKEAIASALAGLR